MKASKTLFLTKDGRIAKNGEEAAFLLVRKGQEIPAGLVQKYGLDKKAGTPKTAERQIIKPAEARIVEPEEIKTSATTEAPPKKKRPGRKPKKVNDA